jgi:xanthine/uracil/vitamin C permease (AzgA family)
MEGDMEEKSKDLYLAIGGSAIAGFLLGWEYGWKTGLAIFILSGLLFTLLTTILHRKY